MSDLVPSDPMDEEIPVERLQPAGVESALRNIVLVLQRDPAAYRHFGVWWWAVKALLKRAGYTRDQVTALGSYHDEESADMMPRAGLIETLEAAMQEYAFNAAYPHSDGLIEAPDGSLVRIWDSDAGL